MCESGAILLAHEQNYFTVFLIFIYSIVYEVFLKNILKLEITYSN